MFHEFFLKYAGYSISTFTDVIRFFFFLFLLSVSFQYLFAKKKKFVRQCLIFCDLIFRSIQFMGDLLCLMIQFLCDMETSLWNLEDCQLTLFNQVDERHLVEPQSYPLSCRSFSLNFTDFQTRRFLLALFHWIQESWASRSSLIFSTACFQG